MDKLTRQRLQELDRRLMEIFTEAFETAVRKNETAFWKLQNFFKYGKGVPRTPEDFRLWDKLTFAEQHAAGWNYLQQLERSEGILSSIGNEIQNSRQTASQLIQNEALSVAETSYRWQAENLKGQLGSAPLNFSHNLYHREYLRVLLANDDIANQPFSKIAFRNYEIHGKTAQNAVIRRLQNQLAQGLALGESIDLIQRRIKSEMVHTSMWQARRIARTETLRTANWGRWLASQQAAEEFGLPTIKEWMSVNDERTRDMHAAMSGQRVRHDEMFVLPNGETARFPLDSSLSPENSINCRCMHVYVLDMEALGVDEVDEDYNRLVDKSRDISYTNLNKKLLEDFKRKLDSSPTPLSDKYKRVLIDRFNQGTPAAKLLLAKHMPDKNIIDINQLTDEQRKRYGIKEKTKGMNIAKAVFVDAEYDITNPRSPGKTFFHEQGHMLDNTGLGGVDVRNELRDLAAKDLDNLRERMTDAEIKALLKGAERDRLSSVSDIISGLTYDPVTNTIGIEGHWKHKSEYWQAVLNIGGAGVEAFAHLLEAQFNPERRAVLQEYFPTMTHKFDEIIEEARRAL